MLQVSTLNTDHQEGYGDELTTGWLEKCQRIAAILFVDYTDLLHWHGGPTRSDEILVQHVLQARHFWAEVLQVTQDNLKLAKCYYYLLMWKFDEGEAKPHLVWETWINPIFILEPDAGDVKIDRKEVNVASATLGMSSCPIASNMYQLSKLLDEAHTTYPCRMSGIVTAHMPSNRYNMAWFFLTEPAFVVEHFMDWYYQTLPYMGITTNITTDGQWVPWEFQSVGLPNIGLEKCSIMVWYVLHHWDSSEGMIFNCATPLKLCNSHAV